MAAQNLKEVKDTTDYRQTKREMGMCQIHRDRDRDKERWVCEKASVERWEAAKEYRAGHLITYNTTQNFLHGSPS
jgi:hypothetical protein